MDSPWALLEIEPTRDPSLIRRAYARQVKAGPDADRFQRLRRAREAALREAGSPGAVALDDGDSPEDQDRKLGRSIGRRDEPTPVDHRAEQEVVEVDTIPRRRIIEIAPLAETEAHKVEATRLKAHLRGLLARLDASDLDSAAIARAMDQAAMLPERPRRDVEAACIEALTAEWRKPDGSFDPAWITRATPWLVAADGAFGWSADDAVLTAVLTPADADALDTILDEAQVAALSPRLPAALRMRRADALAIFTRSAARQALREQAVRRGAMPWRFDWAAFAAPHLWAYHHRLWREMVLLYGAMCLPSLALWAWEVPVMRSQGLRVGLSGLFVLILVLAGLLADRMLFAAALRTIRRADKRAIYDKAPREAFLSERKRLPSPVFFIYLIFPIFFPYWILRETLARLGY